MPRLPNGSRCNFCMDKDICVKYVRFSMDKDICVKYV